ncbi:isocitrate/isopropylmalate family dehydrogenase [Amycolatopsis sp. CA-126428]|uniref:isocitrate/isopropylmalate family dehydrogenase n=1 Tax=Amycolatopsis sp. CA-126428 TaxID=2073158 RepID=UPI0013050078|nr:isocitrate/isopropylmalate family dehydrogenase [Amycolatopsis sp. CA-126428]
MHGSVPDIAGKGLVNPIDAIMSVALLLDDRGLPAAAWAVREAVARTVAAAGASRNSARRRPWPRSAPNCAEPAGKRRSSASDEPGTGPAPGRLSRRVPPGSGTAAG